MKKALDDERKFQQSQNGENKKDTSQWPDVKEAIKNQWPDKWAEMEKVLDAPGMEVLEAKHFEGYGIVTNNAKLKLPGDKIVTFEITPNGASMEGMPLTEPSVAHAKPAPKVLPTTHATTQHSPATTHATTQHGPATTQSDKPKNFDELMKE